MGQRAREHVTKDAVIGFEGRDAGLAGDDIGGQKAKRVGRIQQRGRLDTGRRWSEPPLNLCGCWHAIERRRSERSALVVKAW
jgi:hypothetical protein